MALFYTSLDSIWESFNVFENTEEVTPDYLVLFRDISIQFPPIAGEIRSILHAHPEYYLKLTIEGAIMRIEQYLDAFENVLLLSALNQSQDDIDTNSSVIWSLSELKNAISHLIEAIR